MLTFRSLFIAAAALFAATTASAAEDPPPPYAAYEWLVGEWDAGREEAAPTLVERFRWGSKRSYIWASTSLLQPDGVEHLHFEGMMIWNGASKNFDYLFAVEPGSLVQEKGAFRLEDGKIVRDVLMTSPDGKEGHFRQTFERTGEDTAITSVMRKTDSGWTPTFPGSDRLFMRRRASADAEATE